MRVFRIAAVLALVLFTAHATGLLHLLPVDQCAPDCAQKYQQHDTAPDCDTCECCPAPRIAAVTAPVDLRDDQPRVAALADVARPLTSPEPPDIGHVPKPLA